MSNPSNVTDIGSITSGWVPRQGEGIFFVKITDNGWLTVRVPDIYSKKSVEKLKFVSDKAATKNINRNYIELLAAEFGVGTTTETDLNIVSYVSGGGNEAANDGAKPEGGYVVDGSAVVVNGQRYTVGKVVYYGGYKFIVGSSGDDVYLMHPGGGTASDSPVTGTEEREVKVDYGNATTVVTPAYSNVYAKFENTKDSSEKGKVTIPQNVKISRVLKGSKSNTLRYRECFKFYSGILANDKVSTVTTGEWSGVKSLRS